MEITELLKRCVRVLHIMRKPNGDEFSQVAKITAFGMISLGVIGYVIFLLFTFVLK